MILYSLECLLIEKGYWHSRPDHMALPLVNIHPVGSEAHILCTLYVELYIRREPFRKLRTAEQLMDRMEVLSDILEGAKYPHKAPGVHHLYQEFNLIPPWQDQTSFGLVEIQAKADGFGAKGAAEILGISVEDLLDFSIC